ncbi:TIGR03617 family F420-dependent LLM class oxidoreductase [Gryllotalpicola koreensis]|uniref:LLM class F420-dependent oxidoreductase n=1 Tax=Gryllotalpicola koreensis TaxID=993086 RepID=A0ABP7ZYR3_9MICO
MKIDGFLGITPNEAVATATELRGLGYDGAFTAEVQHDPFVALSRIADPELGLDIGTKIAVAFARSPMTLAYTAHDLNELSGGRLKLGLGSQVSAHITRRFSMPWSAPAERMREYVLALRAIWSSWRTGERLDFEGRHYRHTLMTPNFTPPVTAPNPPQVWIAAVGPKMTEVAAEVSDGILLHGFWTPEYMAQVLEPAIARGLARAGRSRPEIEVTAGGFTITGSTEQEMAEQRERVRAQISFYGSTPTYRGVLEVHGWGELGDRLHELSVSGAKDKWQQMARIVPDEVVDAFAVTAEPARLPAALFELHRRWADRVGVSKPGSVSDADWAAALEPLRAAPGLVAR